MTEHENNMAEVVRRRALGDALVQKIEQYGYDAMEFVTTALAERLLQDGKMPDDFVESKE